MVTFTFLLVFYFHIVEDTPRLILLVSMYPQQEPMRITTLFFQAQLGYGTNCRVGHMLSL